VAAALAAYAAGTGGEHAVLAALASARLLVPVIAVQADSLDAAGGPADEPAWRGEKTSEMAMPSIVGTDGRRALPAFTCIGAVRSWQPAARPVPVPATSVWQAAAGQAWAVIIDIAGPVPVAIDGARLAALASGGAVPQMHEDPDVWQQVAQAAAGIAPGIRVRLSQPRGGLDFTLELAPPDGVVTPVPGEVADRIADAAVARLGGRVRAGVAVLIRPAG